jgi:dTDP-glucose pyrophosphorylase
VIVVVPMAGGDDAFKERGYSFCKPLIEVRGKPLAEHVWTNLKSLKADLHAFIIRKEDSRRFHLDEVLRLMDPAAAIVLSDGPTAGAACTALLAIEHIRPDDELVIANGDQLLACNLGDVVDDFRGKNLDAGTVVFDSVHPRWSFVRLGNDGLVIEAAEKRPISRWATAGFYYFKRGGDFVRAAGNMIRKDAQVNGAFYVCPTFNEMILQHARIGVFKVSREAYISLATPQNLEEYEQSLGRGAQLAAKEKA